MFPVSKKNSQAGFSLVELMVVVAIIGILAAIAVPNMTKYMAKSRQSEAKTNLASLYTAQKAFQAEYNTYYSGLRQVGFVPEGNVRYNVGFTTAVGAPPAGLTAIAGDANNTLALCPANGTTCRTINGYNNGAPGAIAGAMTVTPTTFTAQARAILTVNGTDTWTIDNNKRLINSANGI